MVPYFHLIQLHWVGCYPRSTMPPPYALPFLHVGFSGICEYHFWPNRGCKFHSTYPQGITLYRARLRQQSRISIASTGQKYQNFMECDCMRHCSKRWKNKNFPHIPYYQIPEHFTSEEEKKIKKTLQVNFSKKKMFLAVCASFSGVRSLLWSTMICE